MYVAMEFNLGFIGKLSRYVSNPPLCMARYLVYISIMYILNCDSNELLLFCCIFL